MGTPEFAVPSLDLLVKSGYQVVAVITAPDKPSGRGQIMSKSPVKEYALRNQLEILQPINLKDQDFFRQLKSYRADLQVVVAFRMLPEAVWKMPLMGTFNLHASLLPQYRGAAPINWAIINGEKETGVTTFFINETIDTGNIIFSDRTQINKDESAGTLHDRLMQMGSQLVLKTVKSIAEGNFTSVNQEPLVKESIILKPAPKIFKADCRIDWNKSNHEIHNFIRGLSPYPVAFTKLWSKAGNSMTIKIYESSIPLKDEESDRQNSFTGKLLTDSKHFIKISCGKGQLSIEELQLEGKRRLKTAEFLRGFKIDDVWWVE
jgi:methionyl-tRNA formyltransferase